MGNKSCKKIEEADKADNLYIGCHGNFMQWSVSQEKVTKDYVDIMAHRVTSMKQTSCKRYLFVSDFRGF